MLSVSYAGKNAYSAGKTSGVLRGGALGANRCYVLAHCGGGGSSLFGTLSEIFLFFNNDASPKPFYGVIGMHMSLFQDILII